MRKKQILVEEPVIEEVKVEEKVAHVVEHLDRDLNDPRNAVLPNKLPSLND